jgi:hypothetical protein
VGVVTVSLVYLAIWSDDGRAIPRRVKLELWDLWMFRILGRKLIQEN